MSRNTVGRMRANRAEATPDQHRAELAAALAQVEAETAGVLEAHEI